MLRSLMKKELLALSRDIHGLGALFFMPVVFIIVMSMALKDVYAPAAKEIRYAIVQQDDGRAGQQLAELWKRITRARWLRQKTGARRCAQAASSMCCKSIRGFPWHLQP